ncbi:MAG TPA: glycosyltransferase family 2 protein [Candidatus Sulfotelmatobacter sp.]|nr:glycosyltransferase family 2 protein [Candidatus Sulfotelmatobacter sp.]
MAIKTPVSVFILSRNEERKIGPALESVSWAAEIVVIDSFSTDRTVEIAVAHGAKVVQMEFRKFGELRQAGIEHTTQPWVFSLDSDERCTREARDEIQRIVEDPGSADAYLVPRQNFLLGRRIRHGGWYPDYRQPQLFRRGRMNYGVEDDVHEGWTLQGRLGRMHCPIVQIPYRTLAEAIGKMNRYTSLGVSRQERIGASSNFAKALLHAKWAFFKAYFLQLGFLDGGPGLVIAMLRFENSFYKHAKLIERRRAPPGAD